MNELELYNAGNCATVSNYTGFYGNAPDKYGPTLPGSESDFGGKPFGGRDVMDLQKLIQEGKIKFCSPCKIFIYGCRVANTGTFAAQLSGITGCEVIAGKGEVSTQLPNGKDGTHKDPWRAGGGWSSFSSGKENIPEGPKPIYITPNVNW